MNYDDDSYSFPYKSPLFASIEADEYRTLYFKTQQVLRYGSGVNDMFFFTQVEAIMNSVGNVSAVVTIQVPYPFENREYERWATRNVSVDHLDAVV